jgi:multiple sugar transport system ATP-binding protein
MFPGAEVLEVTIDVVEPIGSHIILLVSSGSTHLTASVDPQTDAKPQMAKELLVDMNRIHLFDKATGGSYS